MSLSAREFRVRRQESVRVAAAGSDAGCWTAGGTYKVCGFDIESELLLLEILEGKLDREPNKAREEMLVVEEQGVRCWLGLGQAGWPPRRGARDVL